MKAVVIEEPAKVYLTADPKAEVAGDIVVGEMIDIEQPPGQAWTTLLLPGQRQAFLPPQTKLQLLRRVDLDQPSARAFEAPSREAPSAFTLARKQQFFLAGDVQAGGETWLRVRHPIGYEGYLPPGTATRSGVSPQLDKARTRMIVGGILLGVGILMTIGAIAATVMAANGTIFIVVAFGPILGGGGMLFSGWDDYNKLRRAPS